MNCHFHFGCPGTPELNLVELSIKTCKDQIRNNDIRTKDEMIEEALKAFNSMNISTFNWKLSRLLTKIILALKYEKL